MNAKIGISLLGLVLLLGLGPVHGADTVRGYQKKVAVSAPTRIDWTFAVATQSVEPPPADWLGNYDSTKQHYELFVPPSYNPKQTYPLVVFVSPSSEPMGWKSWEAPCKQLGILFAGAYEAGNNCPGKRRIRIVLDVLDDIRRNYRIDPDRTYIAGFSGGGRIACGIAFGLPEYFGGVVPICAGGTLREEPWLRHRVIDRLSVAMLTGENDFNRGEVERWRTPFLVDVGVRAKSWTFPKLGHGMPTGAQLQTVLGWLEAGLGQRREAAKKYPAMRMAGDAAPSREAWSKLLLAEGKQRLGARATLYSGLMQLHGCWKRWDGLPAAAEAKKILLEHDARKERPWEEDDIAEQRRFLVASARSLDAYASGALPQQYAKERVNMARQALEWWELIFKDQPESPAGQEAKKRIPELRKIIDKESGN